MPDWIRHPATARLRRERALSRSRTWSHCPPEQVRGDGVWGLRRTRL